MPSLPPGFRAAGLYCGIKRDTSKLDLSLIVSDRPAVAAGVYTQNLVFAAPVELDRSRTPCENIRAVVTNSGNANACTGERGLNDAHEMARFAAAVVGATGEQALVMSTGIIGEFMPLEKIKQGIQAAALKLATDDDSLTNAAKAILTTDTRHKLAGRTLTLFGQTIQITGMCKGAAMIGPRMGTMLGLVLTNATLTPATAQQALSTTVEDTFNCISVDGHMSTNDTVLLLANGGDRSPLVGNDLAIFQTALHEVCSELAQMIPADGEGATHFVTIDVSGCADRAAAHKIAKTVAESALVKCAIAGADPNWGRIVSAAGYAGVMFNPQGVDLLVNGHQLYRQGTPVAFNAEQVSAAIHDQRETHIDLRFSEGTASVRFWTTDLTAEYVRLNADYHT